VTRTAAEEFPKRGYLYVAELDKRRPVLVISLDVRNELASDVLVVPCSTQLSESPTHVRLKRGEGGISTASVLKCEQITTLHKNDLSPRRLGSRLPASLLVEVERGILRAIGIPVPLP
jgi:mRNA interferase MazF